MRFAYADPPYPGQSKRHYSDHPDYAGEVDHANLIRDLERDFPDGWALSTSASALQEVLAVCPPAPDRHDGRRRSGDGVRIACWCVSNGSPFPPQRVMWSWEPVIFRTVVWKQRRAGDFVRDFLVVPNVAGFLGNTITGQKPGPFIDWIAELLGAGPDDEIADLFPGSEVVGRGFAARRAQLVL